MKPDLFGMCVLGLQTSHLLLIRTDLGYGTGLTAACTRQGCSAIGLGFGSRNYVEVFSTFI
jgi:hypothetical protein